MKRFGKLVSLTIQSALFYRASFLFGLFTPLILLGGQFMLWSSLYGQGRGGDIGGFGRADMYAYILISFLINNLLTWSSENALSREIRSGKVVSRCLKPVSFLSQSLAEMVGNILPQALVNSLVVGAAFLLFPGRLALPDPGALPLAILSLLMGLMVRMMMVSCFSLLCFFTTSHLGLSWLRTALMEFFSGALIPVALFPGWLKTLAWCLPFPLMVQTPAALFLNQPLGMPAGLTFALQLIWAAVFLALHQALYARVRRTISFAGG